MNVHEIERLLARYYDGQTNEAEERQLKRFFAEADVPGHLQREKEILLALQAEAEDVPDGLEERLSRCIDEWETRERRTLTVQKHHRLRRLQWIGSIAASVLILFSVGLFLDRPSTPKDTCTTPEEAYIHAQRALTLLSTNLNRGMDELRTVQLTTERIQKQVNNQLNPKR